MRDVETYLDRAEEALRLLALADGREAKLAILEIVRAWIRTAERPARQHGLHSPELTATLEALRRNAEEAGANLDA